MFFPFIVEKKLVLISENQSAYSLYTCESKKTHFKSNLLRFDQCRQVHSKHLVRSLFSHDLVLGLKNENLCSTFTESQSNTVNSLYVNMHCCRETQISQSQWGHLSCHHRAGYVWVHSVWWLAGYLSIWWTHFLEIWWEVMGQRRTH